MWDRIRDRTGVESIDEFVFEFVKLERHKMARLRDIELMMKEMQQIELACRGIQVPSTPQPARTHAHTHTQTHTHTHTALACLDAALTAADPHAARCDPARPPRPCTARHGAPRDRGSSTL